jgi:hypothetical protein
MHELRHSIQSLHRTAAEYHDLAFRPHWQAQQSLSGPVGR